MISLYTFFLKEVQTTCGVLTIPPYKFKSKVTGTCVSQKNKTKSFKCFLTSLFQTPKTSLELASVPHFCINTENDEKLLYFPPYQILTWNLFLTETCARITAVSESCFLGDLQLHGLQTVFAEITELTLLCDRPTHFCKCDAQSPGEK